MCGIAGIVRITHATGHSPGTPSHTLSQPLQSAIPEPWLDTLEAAIRHRGPDGRTIDIALLQGRLSIIDHEGGRQPMICLGARGSQSHALHPGPGTPINRSHLPPPLAFSGSVGGPTLYEALPADRPALAVVFNGCIYNHRPLRAELQSLGHTFTSDHSDTEVLVHGTRAWAEQLTDRLDGMYAYAAWDASRARLLIARDTAGEKPLYLARVTLGAQSSRHAGDTPQAPATYIAVSSSVAGLTGWLRQVSAEHPGTRALQPDPDGIVMWLKHGYWPRMPLNIQEAAPGACYVLGADTPASALSHADPRHILAPCHIIQTHSIGRDTSLDAGRVESLIAQAVSSRLEADVPIGCFLSGGVDSSLVATFAQRELLTRGRRLRTFTVRMPDRRGDESAFADMVARHLGTEHATLDCSPGASGDLVRLIEQLGLPFGDSSLLPTHWVSAAARQHVTVALGGDGGDELFAGYDRYRANAALHAARGWLGWAKHLPAGLVHLVSGKPGRILASLKHHGYDDIATIYRTGELERLIGPPTCRSALERQYAGRAVGGDARQDDFDVYLPFDLMRKVDTAAMAVALEVRAPFLSRPLVDAALSAPLAAVEADERARGGRARKGMLRSLARRLVPPQAIDRRKMGFGAPIGRWFREDFAGLGTLLHDLLGSADPWPGLPIQPDRPYVQRLLTEHMQGSRNHPQRLYALLVASIWARSLARP